MDAVDEPINWSAIACQAFEAKLAEIIKKKGAKDMKEVVARLRASKSRVGDEQYNVGLEAGQEWASTEAEADELMRIGRWRGSVSGDEWDWQFATPENSAYGAGERFVFMVWPEHDGDRQMANEFWERQGYEEHPLDKFVHGFADGALAVWNQVRDQI
jgi:hypothetical protein